MNLQDQITIVVTGHAQNRKEVEKIIKALKDLEINVDERWEAYQKLTELDLLGNQDHGDGNIEILCPGDNAANAYETLGIDPHSTANLTDIYESILDSFEPDAHSTKYGISVITRENLENWRRYVLEHYGAKGIQSFTHDW